MLDDMRKKYIFFAIMLLAVFTSCRERNLLEVEEQEEPLQMILPSREEILAAEITASLSDTELAAQVLMTGIDGNVSLRPAMTELLREIPAGAVMLFAYNLTGDTETIKNLLDETASLIKKSGKNIAPFIAVDHEGGDVHRFSAGITRLPSARSYWEQAQNGNSETVLETIKTDAFSSAEELAYLGINMNLAPVAEIENAENVLFLGSRSYGPDADFTADAAAAFSEGMMKAGVLPVLKHFPGSSGVDPHSGVAVLKQNRDELDAMVMPFTRAAQSGKARAVMISHSIVTAWDAEKNGSLSKTVIEDWLRGNLGFNGIIIADDFSMTAVTGRGIHSEDAVVEALNAGVNLVMVWPKDLKKTLRAIVSALENGSISRETLASRVEKIILEKINLGVISIETTETIN